jgi:hypothetical protein
MIHNGRAFQLYEIVARPSGTARLDAGMADQR